MKISAVSVKNSHSKTELLYDTSVIFLCINKKMKTSIKKDSYNPMFIAALFIKEKIGKQPKYLS